MSKGQHNFKTLRHARYFACTFVSLTEFLRAEQWRMLTTDGDDSGLVEELGLHINHHNETRLGAHAPLIRQTPVTPPSGIKRSERDDEQSPPYSSEYQNARSVRTFFLYILTARRLLSGETFQHSNITATIQVKSSI
jgi:hypothetical protein